LSHDSEQAAVQMEDSKEQKLNKEHYYENC